MPRTSDKPERLRAAAFALTRDRGIDGWTLADVAEAAGIPSGSVFYHFRSKEAMVEGVADELAADVEATLAGLPADDAAGALAALLDGYRAGARDIAAHGTPLGTLTPQLRRTVAVDRVTAIHRLLVDWVAARFGELGFADGAAHARALHLVSGIEGAAALSHALGDPQPLELEAAHLTRWVSRATA